MSGLPGEIGLLPPEEYEDLHRGTALPVGPSAVGAFDVLGDGDLEVADALPRARLGTSSALNGLLHASARALT
jgi:hypothetical protein